MLTLKRILYFIYLAFALLIVALCSGLIDISESVSRHPLQVRWKCPAEAYDFYYWRATTSDESATLGTTEEHFANAERPTDHTVEISVLHGGTFGRSVVGHRWLVIVAISREESTKAWRTVVKVEKPMLEAGRIELGCPGNDSTAWTERDAPD